MTNSSSNTALLLLATAALGIALAVSELTVYLFVENLQHGLIG